jgi:hypothetical protein
VSGQLACASPRCAVPGRHKPDCDTDTCKGLFDDAAYAESWHLRPVTPPTDMEESERD